MENVNATYPMELVHMDYLSNEATEGGKDVHILVITNHFTRYAQAIVTSSQTAKCTAQNLWDKFIVHYGLPEKILTDQGHNFESDLLKALCEIAQVKKIWTSGYHPQTNGQCKHFNATLINMLGTCLSELYLGIMPWGSVHITYMLGCKPCLPIDLIFGTNAHGFKR